MGKNSCMLKGFMLNEFLCMALLVKFLLANAYREPTMCQDLTVLGDPDVLADEPDKNACFQ